MSFKTSMLLYINLQGMHQVWKCFKNKYVITALAVIVWVLCFDENDAFSQWEMYKRCEKLKQDKAYYTHEIEYCKRMTHHLKTNPLELERLARERYHMKRDGEVLFVMVQKSKK
ncbi:MAG: FtsB family cell division protein [Bacteroidia bacterium]